MRLAFGHCNWISLEDESCPPGELARELACAIDVELRDLRPEEGLPLASALEGVAFRGACEGPSISLQRRVLHVAFAARGYVRATRPGE